MPSRSWTALKQREKSDYFTKASSWTSGLCQLRISLTLPNKFSPDFTLASVLGNGFATGSWKHAHTVFVAVSAGGSHSKAISDLARSFSHVILSPYDFWLS